MDFQTLNETIPYVYDGKKYLLEYRPYNAITLRMPGRHSTETTPIGGDFVVCVDDESLEWTQHKFTHSDIFLDLEKKAAKDNRTPDLIIDYLAVVKGIDPDSFEWSRGAWTDSLHPETFIRAVQCLAIAEHRRYARFENKFGGRWLPLRFACGIVEGRWTATDATARQKMGRPGVEWLEKEHGVPQLTKDLIGVRSISKI